MSRMNALIRNTWTHRLMVLAALGFAVLTPFALSGCNTTEGVGEDMQAAGDAISDAAEDASD